MKPSLRPLIGIQLLLTLWICIPCTSYATQVGSTGVTFDLTKLDPNYPQMSHWITAGVRGGIPSVNQIPIKHTLSSGSNSSAINVAINTVSAAGGGAVYLENGTYTINDEVTMKTGVSLIGESRDGVVCTIHPSMTANRGAFEFQSINNAGIYRLTIQGGWGIPTYDWNYSISANNELPGNENISVFIKNSLDCWVDDCNILNSADFPVRISADHITIRNCRIDGVFNKQGGAHGYFFILNGYNLVTGCQITHLRHISLQGDGVRYNVLYDNDFMQEVSFHSGDDGDNLIENNRIHLPADMPNGSNGPNYFSIMGPWSSQHHISARPNYIYRNDVIEYNHGGARPWSDPNTVYYGPHYVRPANPLINFTPYSVGPPSGGTLYPVILGEMVDVESCEVSPETAILKERDSTQLSASILPINASNLAVQWSSTQPTIASVDPSGHVTALLRGTTDIIATTVDGGFTGTSEITVIPATETVSRRTPIDDAYLQNGTNHNTQILRVENGNRVAYMKFDLGAVTEAPSEASLSLTVAADGGNGQIIVQEASATSWTETTLTSANAPVAVIQIASLNQTFNSGQHYTWDIDPAVFSNGGVIHLIVSQLSGNDVSFVSSEGAAGSHPQLNLTLPASALDQWLSQHQLYDPNADTDFDQHSNYAEFKFGTDPLNSKSLPLLQIDSDPTQAHLFFRSTANQSYTIQYKHSLLGNWLELEADIPGNDDMIDRPINTDESQTFYRVIAH